MRLLEIYCADLKPLKLVHIDDLSTVIVIAGPNGVGKTRLISGLLQHIQNLAVDPRFYVRIEATSSTERSDWGRDVLDTRNAPDVQLLTTTIRKNRRRAHFTSSFLNFESNRSIQQIVPFNWDWNYADPFEEEVGWNFGWHNMTQRWQDVQHSIFRKIRSRREAIALHYDQLIRRRSLALAEAGQSAVETERLDKEPISIDPTNFPDALTPFKNAFSQLLAPKILIDPKIQNQQLEYRTEGGDDLPITALSSGEREVTNIVFDFLLRDPSDCVAIFDEPELHLHPELSFRLLQTLRRTGNRNQFIFCTHSAEIITASLDNTVVFIAPPSADASNQAIKVKDDDETHEALQLLGQSIGIISLGKKLVLIEGGQASLDKQTYGQILKDRFPKLVLVASGGAGLLRSFSSLNDKVLKKTIWGVEFFMLCDRDALPVEDPSDIERRSDGRVRLLKRYHLENYFLDEYTIAKVFDSLTEAGNWLRDPKQIRDRLRSIASDYVSYAAALVATAKFREEFGNVDLMPKGCDGKDVSELTTLILSRVREERSRAELVLDDKSISDFVEKTFNRISHSLAADTDDWKWLVPAKPIIAKFCAATPLKYDGLKTSYINTSEVMSVNPFADIIDIFSGFDSVTA
jgi:energy-coupling factor transporter ATP-binding protein EcfA2